MSIGVGPSLENTLIALQRLHSLAFGFGTFAYATGQSRRKYMSDKDRASSPHDGFLRDAPTPFLMTYLG